MRRMMGTAALALLVAAGCGSGDGGNGVATLADGARATPSATASADPEDALRQFAKCMREHGVDVPDPGADGAGGGAIVVAPGQGAPDEFEAADKACGHHLKGVLQEGPPRDDPEMHDRALKFAKCMREHGIDLPDPGPNGAIQKAAPSGGAGVEKPPFESPKFKAAQRACEPLLQLTPQGQP